MNIRDSAAGKDCAVRLPGICNRDPATTVHAHFRLVNVSGMGLKVPDFMGARACSACHAYIDTHHDDATQLAFAHGCFRTQVDLHKEGLLRIGHG